MQLNNSGQSSPSQPEDKSALNGQPVSGKPGGVENQQVSEVYRSEAGETLLSRALDIISGQLSSLRELNEAARHLSEEAARERRNIFMAREEVEYRLRYLEQKKTQKKSDKAGAALPVPGNLDEFRKVLQDQQAKLENRERELSGVQNDMEDASRRLGLLVRQLEIAGSQLTRSSGVASPTQETANPWEIVLRAQLVQGQEEERGRLAREVHDGPAQVLANAVMRLEHGSSMLRQNKTEAQKEFESLAGVMRESLFELRRFMFNLQPKTLVQNGLTKTLQEYCADFGNQYALEIEIDLPDLEGLLSQEQEMAVFRIVQESLQNVRKHAEARRVHIYGSRDQDGLISIIIRDDGKGFVIRTAELGITRGAGIPGMRERAELVGGSLKIRSTLGMGTEVLIKLRPKGQQAAQGL